MKSLRKFFGCSPKVGDKITACTDYGVRFEGIVTDDTKAKNEDFPHYRASGEWFIRTWKGEIGKPDTNAIILSRDAKLA
jgi:hypothetical protein